MSIGSVLNETFEYYRRAWRQYALLGGLVFLPLGLLVAVTQHHSGTALRSLYVWSVVSKVAMIVATTWLQAAVAIRSEQQRNGRPLPGPRETVELVQPYLFPVLAVSALSAVAFLLLSFLGVIGLPFLVFLLTRWVVLIPVTVIEGLTVKAVFRRANELAKGKFFDLLLMALLSVIIVAVVYLVGAAITGALPRFASSWIALVFVGAIGVPPVMLMWTVAFFQLSRRTMRGVPA
jgi:hypothetical protein